MTRGSSYIELLEWIKDKKAVIHPKNKDKECFNWTVIAALYHEEIKKDHQRMSKLGHYENQYNWEGLEFSVSIKKIDKFEKNNPGMVVNVLFNSKKNQTKNIYTVCRSGHNGKCIKQLNLLMIEDGEKRQYTAIKNISRLLSKLNEKARSAYHYCMNCLNGFGTDSARDKHYEYYSSNGHVKVNMPTGKEKWLSFHNGQYQFKVPFMLHTDFESILKPLRKRYKDKTNTIKAQGKHKASYTDKINANVLSGWGVNSTFAHDKQNKKEEITAATRVYIEGQPTIIQT